MVGKTVGALIQIKIIAPDPASSHCVSYCHTLAVEEEKKSISFKNVSDEAVKMINFIKSQPLNISPFNIFLWGNYTL